MKQDIRNKIPLYMAIGLFLVYHLATLDVNPLPWFDETYFASIGHTLFKEGRLIPAIAYTAKNGKETFTYGPLYFILTGSSMKIFGTGIFAFRIVNLLAGMVCIYLTYCIIRRRPQPLSMLLPLLMLTDPFFGLVLHEGRMDLMATALVLAALLCYLKDRKNLFPIGLFLAAALLTTPRSAVIIIPFAFLCLWDLYKKHYDIRHLTMGGLPIFCCLSIWIFYAFGGPLEMMVYFKQVNTLQANAGYLGGRWYIPKAEYLLIVLAIFSLMLMRLRGINMHKVIVFSILAICSFYLIVLDWGQYSAHIIPFYYILLYSSGENIRWDHKQPFAWIIALLLVYNVSYTSIKALQVFSEKEQRDANSAYEFVKANIPAGSKVIGDAMYYYAVLQSGSHYELYNEYDVPEERERKHRELLNYDYLIITKLSELREKETIDLYQKNAHLVPVATLSTTRGKMAERIAGLGIISDMEKHGYEATIYKRSYKK